MRLDLLIILLTGPGRSRWWFIARAVEFDQTWLITSSGKLHFEPSRCGLEEYKTKSLHLLIPHSYSKIRTPLQRKQAWIARSVLLSRRPNSSKEESGTHGVCFSALTFDHTNSSKTLLAFCRVILKDTVGVGIAADWYIFVKLHEKGGCWVSKLDLR